MTSSPLRASRSAAAMGIAWALAGLASATPVETEPSEPLALTFVDAPLVLTETHSIEDPEIDESSGLVASRRYPGVFWTHNDSGDSARIFAISRSGEKLAEYRVEGAANVDWEDIAIDPRGQLYLGDVGNNGNARRDLAVYVVAEPDPSRSGAVAVERVLRFRYSDQTAFPDPTRRDFDCEAILYADDAIYLFTKHRGNTRTKIYRLPTDGTDQAEMSLEPQATLALESRSPLGVVTAVDLSADGRRVALLTYTSLWVYQRERDSLAPSGLATRIELTTGQTRQAESVAWDGPAIVIGNEQRALFRLEGPTVGSPLPEDPPSEDPVPEDPVP